MLGRTVALPIYTSDDRRRLVEKALLSVLCHRGDDVRSGEYWAFVRTFVPVEECTWTRVAMEHANVYMLFYGRFSVEEVIVPGKRGPTPPDCRTSNQHKAKTSTTKSVASDPEDMDCGHIEDERSLLDDQHAGLVNTKTYAGSMLCFSVWCRCGTIRLRTQTRYNVPKVAKMLGRFLRDLATNPRESSLDAGELLEDLATWIQNTPAEGRSGDGP
jgi:hypothetical protein